MMRWLKHPYSPRMCLLLLLSVKIIFIVTVVRHAQSIVFDREDEVIITSENRGRLGNKICTYAHLLDLQLDFNVTSMPNEALLNSLSRTFPSLTLKPFRRYRNSLKFAGSLQDVRAELMKNNSKMSSLMTGAPCSLQDFWHHRARWLQEFQFSQNILDKVDQRHQKYISEWQTKMATDATPETVCVHVRMGDIKIVLNKYNYTKLITTQYYYDAIQYFEDRYKDAMLLVFTEPTHWKWCEENIVVYRPNVFMVKDSKQAEQDFAFIASCKHIVYSYGTYGLWAILLSKAKTVVYPAPLNRPNSIRYSHHKELDIFSKNMTETSFVQIPTFEIEN